VDDPGGMGFGQRVGDLDRDIEQLTQWHTVTQGAAVKRHARDVFHHDEFDAIRRRDVVDNDNIRMIQRGRRLRFLHEALFAASVGDLVRRKHLDRDQPIKARVPRLPDRAHAAFTELFYNLVVEERAAEHSLNCNAGLHGGGSVWIPIVRWLQGG